MLEANRTMISIGFKHNRVYDTHAVQDLGMKDTMHFYGQGWPRGSIFHIMFIAVGRGRA
jgi:hypothetical protein